MRHVFSIPYIIAISLWMTPAITIAMTFYHGPRTQNIEWNNFASHAVLKQRAALDALKDYTPKLNIGIKGGLTENCLEGQANAILYFPWMTIVGASDLGNLEHSKGEISLIIGDFNRFPAYFQAGIMDGMVGRHASELLLMPSLTTRKSFCLFTCNNRFNWGGKVGGHYSLNNYGQLKAEGVLSLEGTVGANVEYNLNYADIHFLAGGGTGWLMYDGGAKGSFDNVYAEMSGQEKRFNNIVKCKVETFWARELRERSNRLPEGVFYTAVHAEASYHMPLYYFGNPSAIVVGYASSGETVGYGFGGMKINCFKYFDVVMGMTYGKLSAWNKGINPLLQLQFAL